MCYSAKPEMVEWKCAQGRDHVLCILGAQTPASDEILSFFECDFLRPDFTRLLLRLSVFAWTCWHWSFSLLEPVSMLKKCVCVLLYEWLCSLRRCYTCSHEAGWGRAGGLLPWCWRNKSICSKAPISSYYQGKLKSEEQNHDISASLGEDLYIQLINYSSVPFTPDSRLLYYFIHLFLFLLNLSQAFVSFCLTFSLCFYRIFSWYFTYNWECTASASDEAVCKCCQAGKVEDISWTNKAQGT